MSNIKDKLIEIVKKAIVSNAEVFEDNCVTLCDNYFGNACEEIADGIIENLPKLLEDSEWVRIPAKIGDTIYFTCGDEIKSIVVRKIRLNGSNYITYFGHEPNDKSHKTINVYEDNRVTEAEAAAKLAELKGVKENE